MGKIIKWSVRMVDIPSGKTEDFEQEVEVEERPTISELMLLADSRKPIVDPFTLRELGANIGRLDINVPSFTGWKPTYPGLGDVMRRHPRELIDKTIFDFGEEEFLVYVGQWMYFICDDENRAASTQVIVNLPEMNVSIKSILDQTPFEIGTVRIRASDPAELLDRLVRDGYGKLMEVVKEIRSRPA